MILVVWDILCIALFYAVFGRSVRTDTTTRLSVRLSMWFVGISSLFGLAVPMYGWSPDWVVIAMVGPLVFMQFVMSKHWVFGVPSQFVKPKFLRGNRRKADIKWL